MVTKLSLRTRIWGMYLLFLGSIIFPLVSHAAFKYTLQSYIPYKKFEDLLVAILNIFIVIATPIIVLFIIYGGFQYVTARGNPAQIQQATKTLTYAIIGGVMIIGAVAVTQIVGNIVAGLSS